MQHLVESLQWHQEDTCHMTPTFHFEVSNVSPPTLRKRQWQKSGIFAQVLQTRCRLTDVEVILAVTIWFNETGTIIYLATKRHVRIY